MDKYVHDNTVNDARSSLVHTSTGAPQGCVISPILFILYTNDCIRLAKNCLTIKFADNADLADLIKDSAIEYKTEITKLTTWCKDNYLFLNANKTKEMIIDFRKDKLSFVPVEIDNEEIEIVDEYKYLGTIIDSELNWNSNTDFIFLKSAASVFPASS